MSGKKLLFEDGVKKVLEDESEDHLIQSFTDNIVSSDGKKNSRVKGKGPINNAIAVHLFEYLESYNIPTHFINKIGDREMQVRKTEIYPVTVHVHNELSSTLKKKYNTDEKHEVQAPLVEFYYGQKRIFNPVQNSFEDNAIEVTGDDELRTMSRDTFKINALVKKFFARRNIEVTRLTLQFGKYRGRVVLSSEITPDSCRLLDTESKDLLSSERFDKGLGSLTESYQKVYNRVLGEE